MTYMTPTQISTNVITPGVEVSVVVAYPNGESWAGTLRNTTVRKRHGARDIGDGRIWCEACNTEADRCTEAIDLTRIKHGAYPASGGQLWCPACEAPVEECREADEIRRRIANLEGRTDD